jgi:cation diffusion facilitator family transporter
MKDRDALTSLTVNLGLISNVVLAALKTSIGILGYSPALLADGINSTSDVVYYIAVKIFMTQAKKPADKEHPYGHRQLESISAIVVGAFILTTGIAIFLESINKVYELITLSEIGRSASVWALFIAVGTLVLKLGLYFYTKKTANKTHNPTIRALANDHFNDIMAAGAVIIGVIMGRMGFFWMDPAAGAIVAIYIIKTGVEIIMDSSSELMDRIPDHDFGRELRDITLMVDGVKGIEEVGIHRFGPYFTISMTISVAGDISIDEGHDISHKVEQSLLKHFDNGLRNVHIHYHPHDTNKASKQGVSTI